MGTILHGWSGSWKRLVLCACLLLCGSAARLAAQTPQPHPPGTPVLQPMYFNKKVIQLPVQVQDDFRARIREIQLYVKDQPKAPWTLRDKVTPDKDAFVFQAARDGEYAFTMVIVDL